MKSSSFVVKIIATAIVASTFLFFMSCKDSGTNTATTPGVPEGAEGGSGLILPIAYVNVDSILVNYNYAKEVNEKLTKKVEDNRLTLNREGTKLEKEMQDFQQKLQNNIFLSEDRAQQEYARIMKQQQGLEERAQRLQTELAIEQQKENIQISDSIQTIIKLINETEKFEVIFNKSLDNIILASPKYDITQQVLTMLNARYKSTAKN